MPGATDCMDKISCTASKKQSFKSIEYNECFGISCLGFFYPTFI